jgi:hypothetical protein
MVNSETKIEIKMEMINGKLEISGNLKKRRK